MSEITVDKINLSPSHSLFIQTKRGRILLSQTHISGWGRGRPALYFDLFSPSGTENYPESGVTNFYFDADTEDAHPWRVTPSGVAVEFAYGSNPSFFAWDKSGTAFSNDGPTSVVYTQQQISLSTASPSIAKPPTLDTFGGTTIAQYKFAKSVENTVYFSVEMPTGYAVGENLFFHVHGTKNSETGAPTQNVTLQFAYVVSQPGAAFSTEITTTKTFDVSGDTALYLEDYDLGEIDMSAVSTQDAILLCRLSRVASSGNEYDDFFWIFNIDANVPISSMGTLTPES